MKLAVFAYHDIGYECLQHLLEAREEVVALVTHQDDPKEEIWFRSAAQLARERGLPVYTPDSPNTASFMDLIRGLAPDIIFSFYYRRLLSQDLLAVPRLGAINLHGSLLPRYRGRCPVNWVLIHGETETGVTLHHMVAKADAGDIIAQRRVPIDDADTALALHRKLTVAARQLLVETYPLIKAGTAPRIPQDPALATTFGGRRPEDGKIFWQSSAPAIHNLVRAVTRPYPGAFTCLRGRKLYLWETVVAGECRAMEPGPSGNIRAIQPGSGILVGTGEGHLMLKRLQLEGEEELSADVFAREVRLQVGERLGEP